MKIKPGIIKDIGIGDTAIVNDKKGTVHFFAPGTRVTVIHIRPNGSVMCIGPKQSDGIPIEQSLKINQLDRED